MASSELSAGAVRRPLLVVDDDDEIREALEDLLAASGYQVVTAANGQEALDLLQGVDPGLVLLDLMMPVMDGHEFLRRLASTPARATPVIVVTAAGPTGIEGAAATVAKPFSAEMLIRLIETHRR